MEGIQSNAGMPLFSSTFSRNGCHLGLFNPRFHKTEIMERLLGSESVTGVQSKSWDYFEIIGHKGIISYK